VVGIDNDGRENLVRSGGQEDPLYPRHWNHAVPVDHCRFCTLQRLVEKERAKLPALPQKPPSTWPVLIAVPVEVVEAWVLELQAILDPARGLSPAENHPRESFKQKLYGQPFVTTDKVRTVALPIVERAKPHHLTELRKRSKSFEQFASQVDAHRHWLLEPGDCWTEGDRASER
jgi:hypothetical protein